MPADPEPSDPRVRLPGLDPDATPVVGLGLGLTGLLLGLRPRMAAWPLALTAAAALFYRDPERLTPGTPGAIFAPADGVVRGVEETYEHRFLHTDALRITVAVSPVDVPVQRSPVSGRVAYVEEVGAEQRIGWAQRGGDSERGACLLIGIDTGLAPVLLAISASALSRRPACRIALADQLAAGGRVATSRLGARVDLLVPAGAVAISAAVGDQVRAGLTPIGAILATRA